MLNKKGLRTSMIEKRKKLSLDDKKLLDMTIYNKVINCAEYLNAKVIFIFVSCMGEVDTHCIINHAIANRKLVCVPKVISLKEGMIPIVIHGIEEMKPNKMGILEPISIEGEIDINEIDLIIVPGLAFDKHGGRLGYGGGFYDRFLPLINDDVPKIGIAYNFQVVDQVPSEEHDFKLNHIITN